MNTNTSSSSDSSADTTSVDDFDLGFNQTPDQLIGWLDAKYARHGEDDDRQAAELLRKLVAQAPANDERAIVAGAKVQAKRLLKLAKKNPLKITALNEALGVVAQLHGYPHWQAMAASVPPHPAVRPANAILESLSPIQGPGRSVDVGMPAVDSSDGRGRIAAPVTLTEDNTAAARAPYAHQLEGFHIDTSSGLHRSQLRDWVEQMSRHHGCINVFTPNLDAIEASNVQKVSVDELLLINPLLPPLGSKAMLPAQLDMLVTVLLSVRGQEENSDARTLLTWTIEQVLEKHFLASTTQNPSYEEDVVAPTAWARTQGLISDGAQAFLEEQRPLSRFEASVQLQLAGFEEEAWFFHTFELPRPRAIATALDNLVNFKVETGPPGLTVAKECLAAWTTHWVRNDALRSSKPWTLTTLKTVAFEVNPGALDTEFPATTRWLLAVLMGHYRRTSVWITDHNNRIPQSAYDQPHVAPWAQSIPRERREAVLSWHMDRTRLLQSGINIDLFDEMDGPLNAEVVENAIRRLTYSGTRMGVGVWLMLENKPRSHMLRDHLTHSLLGPLTLPA